MVRTTRTDAVTHRVLSSIPGAARVRRSVAEYERLIGKEGCRLSPNGKGREPKLQIVGNQG